MKLIKKCFPFSYFLCLLACGGNDDFSLNILIEGEGSLTSNPAALLCDGPKDCGTVTWKDTSTITIQPTAKAGYKLGSFKLQTAQGEIPTESVDSIEIQVEDARKAGFTKLTAVFVVTDAQGQNAGTTTDGRTATTGGTTPNNATSQTLDPQNSNPLCPSSPPTLNTFCQYRELRGNNRCEYGAGTSEPSMYRCAMSNRDQSFGWERGDLP